MPAPESLNRFIEAQKSDYQTALTEIRNGRKRSHWMWYIFPQLKGLGFSETARYYGIANLAEAGAYLNHPLLGERLKEISNALLLPDNTNANQIFGSPDDLKLRSCMTLFSLLPNADPVFEKVLARFFNAEKDEKTVQLLNG